MPLPLGAMARDQSQRLIGHGWSDLGFSALRLLAAQSAGVKLAPEDDRAIGIDRSG